MQHTFMFRSRNVVRRGVLFGSSCSKRRNSILEFHLPKCQRIASRSLGLLAFDKIRLSGWYRMGPVMAGFTYHNQKAVGLKQKMCREDLSEANRITQAESKLRDAIVSPKQSWQSIWAEMPCPG